MILRSPISFLALVMGLILKPVLANGAEGTSRETYAAREYFYVGGNYIETNNGHIFVNQMYVEKLTPVKPCQPYPLVFIHGQGQTGTVGFFPRPHQPQK